MDSLTSTSELTNDTQKEGFSLEQLVTDFHQPLYRYAFRLSGQQADAEDLTQQCFLQAREKLHQLRDPEKAQGWLYAILRNCFLKQQRKKQPTPVSTLEINVDEIPGSITESEIDQTALKQALDELSDDFRLVLVMYYFDDSSYQEIAEQLNLPQGTVMSRLSRAKSKLRAKLLTQQGIVDTQG